MIKYKKDIDNIVTLTLDMADSNKNVINHEISKVFSPIVQQLEHEKKRRQLKGVIITSAKHNFLEGGKLSYLFKTDKVSIFNAAENLKQLYRRLEQIGVPIVAAINGSALGAGCELTLACHHRIAIHDTTSLIGFPEIRLGFISGGGGLVRLTWLLGLKAFEVLSSGKVFRPQQALEIGLVNELVTHENELVDRAKCWILEHPKARQVWDTKDKMDSVVNVKNTETAKWIAYNTANIAKKTKNNYLIHQAVLDIIVNSLSLDFDTASRIESRYFTQLVMHPDTKNMIKALWYDMNAIKGGVSRPKGFGRFRPKKIGVIGAGTIGSMIAYSCVSAGMDVILKDVSKPIAERGKRKAEILLKNAVKKGLLLSSQTKTMLECIRTTKTSKDFKECDLVIEAVFENSAVKNKVTKEAEPHLDEYAFIATATSSLSVSRLSKVLNRPEQFIGLLFHLPADEGRMVEVIKGKQTSDETLSRALDFVRKIRRIPVVVNDRRGFLSARIKEMYALEGVALLLEGVPAAVVEKAGLMAGMQQGPLEMLDDMSIALTLKFMERKLKVFKEDYYHKEEVETLQRMVNEWKRTGRRSNHGFYNYKDDGTKTLWHGLTEVFPTKQSFDFKEIQNRLLFTQSIEAIRILETGAVDHAEELNIGSILGWGFPDFKGGVLQYVNDFGVVAFVDRAKDYADRFGNRFEAPQLLLDKLAKEELF